MMIDIKKIVGILISGIVSLIICIILQLMMSGCTRKVYVPVETVRTDSVMIVKAAVDTVMTHDSIYVREANDSVYVYRYKTEYKYKLRTDTLWSVKVDSVAVPYEVVKEKKYVPKGVWWGYAIMLLTILGLGAYIKIRK